MYWCCVSSQYGVVNSIVVCACMIVGLIFEHLVNTNKNIGIGNQFHSKIIRLSISSMNSEWHQFKGPSINDVHFLQWQTCVLVSRICVLQLYTLWETRIDLLTALTKVDVIFGRSLKIISKVWSPLKDGAVVEFFENFCFISGNS